MNLSQILTPLIKTDPHFINFKVVTDSAYEQALLLTTDQNDLNDQPYQIFIYSTNSKDYTLTLNLKTTFHLNGNEIDRISSWDWQQLLDQITHHQLTFDLQANLNRHEPQFLNQPYFQEDLTIVYDALTYLKGISQLLKSHLNVRSL